MRNYRVLNYVNYFDVVEAPSDQIIKRFNKKEDAIKLYNHLNRGGGFDGATPPFFLINSKKGKV